jgi:hypothetical protein
MAKFEQRKIPIQEGSLEIVAKCNGGVRLLVSQGDDFAGVDLTGNEVKELCAALRMSLEEAQAALPEGPAFERDEYLRVVATSAVRAMQFMERDDEPEDLGPAEASRYRAGARVWGFKLRGKK